MAGKGRSVVLPVVAAAVFAGLGRMVLRKIIEDRAARENAREKRIGIHVDESMRARISHVMRHPRS